MKFYNGSGVEITDDVDDDLGTVHLELSPLDKGRELSKAQPNMGKVKGDFFVVNLLDFAAMVSAYFLVRECENDFFECLPGLTNLANMWRALARGVYDWSKCEKGIFQARLDESYRGMSDKSVFYENDDDWIWNAAWPVGPLGGENPSEAEGVEKFLEPVPQGNIHAP